MIEIIKRWFFIWSVIAKYRLDLVFPIFAKKKWITALLWLTPAAKNADTSIDDYVRIRKAIEELGPIFIKFGQALSTRPDLLPPGLTKELSKLQDKVKPYPIEESIALIEKSFNASVDELFLSFEKEILASASIAQVHAATLHSGEDVIVKVVRPGIEKIINRDLRTMRLIAKLVNSLVSDLRRLRLPDAVREFSQSINGELDLRQEAANASKLRGNFPDSNIIYVPKVYWDMVSQNVMVMERIFATRISDMQALEDNNVNMEKLANIGIEIFFTQVFYHKYFHADMHPGNIFVDISDPENPKYNAIDFGIMGTLSDEDQYYMIENFLAFFNRDYYRVAKLHIDSGWVPAYVKVHELEAAVRKVGEPIFGKPLDEIAFSEVIMTILEVARQFDLIIQPQLLLLQKTIFNVEGLGRVLYPKLDLWATAKPILERWIKDNFGPKAFLKQLRNSAVDYRDIIPKIPQLIDKQLSVQPNQTPSSNRKTPWAILFGTLLLIAVLPQLWHEDISRPLAIAGAFIVGIKLFRQHY